MISRQTKPRNWCNCKLEASARGDEQEEMRLLNKIASVRYAHETGRCRFEYDPDEQPIGEIV